jgi:putative transcriptional regulator
MSFDLTGQMLIATPAVGDPRFERSVIYICVHSPEGAFGLIVNRALPAPDLAEVLAQLRLTPQVQLPPTPVRAGGPVNTAQGFVLHSPDVRVVDATQDLAEGVSLTASTEILAAVVRGAGPARWFLALGYSGWGPGQLETEIARNAWLTAPAPPDLLFAQPGPYQWRAALALIGVDPRGLSGVSGTA